MVYDMSSKGVFRKVCSGIVLPMGESDRAIPIWHWTSEFRNFKEHGLYVSDGGFSMGRVQQCFRLWISKNSRNQQLKFFYRKVSKKSFDRLAED